MKPNVRTKMILVDCLSIISAGIGGLILFFYLRKRTPAASVVALDAFVFMVCIDCIAIVCFLFNASLLIFEIFFGLSSPLVTSLISIGFIYIPRGFLVCEILIMLVRSMGIYCGYYPRYPLPSRKASERMKRFVISFGPPDEVDKLMCLSVKNALHQDLDLFGK
jgi:hypothetical protein